MHGDAAVQVRPAGDLHRRRAAHLYGLILVGSVLVTVSDDYRLLRVGVVLGATLAVYWAAESYVHWNAARAQAGRPLTRAETTAIVRDGWPLVAAGGIPLLCLAIEAVLTVDTALAVRITLLVNAVLLFLTGLRAGRSGGLTGARLFLDAALAGLLGLVLVVLKALLH
ncbi:hypothetical protein [Aquipuribacter nitratireducens]|uniref:Integral membrane protein n=1 Tax=Aquipuribacter nitratireducens TaxID=650104 RepID=A0ABW0GJX2_9MICO